MLLIKIVHLDKKTEESVILRLIKMSFDVKKKELNLNNFKYQALCQFTKSSILIEAHSFYR
jgi:hypothetical protein